MKLKDPFRDYKSGIDSIVTILPLWFKNKFQKQWRQFNVPPSKWESLRQVYPVSQNYGCDRGQAIDRYYIEKFLYRHCQDIKGRVLEVQSSGYADQFGGKSVTQKDVLDIDSKNKNATFVSDLAKADPIPSNHFDCFILTQVIQYIFDFHSALYHAVRILKPSGVLLATLPSVSRRDPQSGTTDYWRFTEASARRLFEEFYPRENIDITVAGNVLVDAAFLMGLASHELEENELKFNDPAFPLLICVRAVKPSNFGESPKKNWKEADERGY